MQWGRASRDNGNMEEIGRWIAGAAQGLGIPGDSAHFRLEQERGSKDHNVLHAKDMGTPKNSARVQGVEPIHHRRRTRVERQTKAAKEGEEHGHRARVGKEKESAI